MRGRRAWLVVLLATACADTAETKAWRARKTELAAAVATLQALDADRAAAEVKWDLVQPQWVAVQATLDVVSNARAADAGVRAFQDERGTSLSFEGSLEACRDALAALGHARKLTAGWKLRIDPDGTCRWQALEAPAVYLFRLGDAPQRWAAPRSEVISRGVDALRLDVKDLEAQRLKLESSLGALALVPAMEARLSRGRDVLDAVARSPVPCDLAVVSRAIELNQRGLLEVSAITLVHPLAAEDDVRTRGLATRLPDGPLVWTCE